MVVDADHGLALDGLKLGRRQLVLGTGEWDAIALDLSVRRVQIERGIGVRSCLLLYSGHSSLAFPGIKSRCANSIRLTRETDKPNWRAICDTLICDA